MSDIQRLKLALAILKPTFLEIQNQSQKHHGHTNSPNTDQSHYNIQIKSPLFNGLSYIQQHRLVYQALTKEWKKGLHSISITIINK